MLVTSVQGMGSQLVEVVNHRSGWLMHARCTIYIHCWCAIIQFHVRVVKCVCCTIYMRKYTVVIVCKYENLLLCVGASKYAMRFTLPGACLASFMVLSKESKEGVI